MACRLAVVSGALGLAFIALLTLIGWLPPRITSSHLPLFSGSSLSATGRRATADDAWQWGTSAQRFDVAADAATQQVNTGAGQWRRLTVTGCDGETLPIDPTLAPGQTLHLSIRGLRDGVLQLHFVGENVQQFQARIDSAGAVELVVVVPSVFGAGQHLLTVQQGSNVALFYFIIGQRPVAADCVVGHVAAGEL